MGKENKIQVDFRAKERPEEDIRCGLQKKQEMKLRMRLRMAWAVASKFSRQNWVGLIAKP